MSMPPADGRARLLSLLPGLRPELHRYCARLTGSLFEGEDIVQDALERALLAVDTLDPATPLRPWLFRIAHNRALDHLRSRAVRHSEPIEAAAQTVDELAPDPADAIAHQQALDTAISRFSQLPIVQRSVIVLKDVLGHSLQEIADLLGLTVSAVKAALSRGRIRLREINAAAPVVAPTARPASPEAARFASLFNQRNWSALRAMLADDVHLTQATHADRRGATDVGMFFTIYAKLPPFRLVPAYLDDGASSEVIAAFAHHGDMQPAYLMKVEWRDERIVRIRDFRYAGYVLEGASLMLAARSGA